MGNLIPTDLNSSESNDEKIVKVAEKTLQGVPILEAEPYKISFSDKYYKHKECEVKGLSPQNAACALKVIRDIGVFYFDKDHFQKNTLGFLEIKHVGNAGAYAVLYKGLELDEVVYEIKCVKENKKKSDIDFRIFYTLNDSARIFNIIAIRQSHY